MTWFRPCNGGRIADGHMVFISLLVFTTAQAGGVWWTLFAVALSHPGCHAVPICGLGMEQHRVSLSLLGQSALLSVSDFLISDLPDFPPQIPDLGFASPPAWLCFSVDSSVASCHAWHGAAQRHEQLVQAAAPLWYSTAALGFLPGWVMPAPVSC